MDINKITDDKFLKELDNKQLNEVAKQIRSFIVENVSKTGGHLSSNLGSVELIMALHKEFNLPEDKLLFDVGHQAYTHKILTGRANKFSTLRKFNGLSGFLDSNESPYDVFSSGHSSTSISTAMGMAASRDTNHENYEVIAFIGDGAIANGISFEALNDISLEKHKVIIVLNDNDMAINRSVGAMANALSKIRTSKSYAIAKNGFIGFFNKIPVIGPKFVNFMHRLIHRLVLIFRSDNIFDNFNISYLGPVDGHNFKALEKAFKKAKKFPNSIIVHVKTTKGNGYKIFENDKNGTFHGVAPFDVNTGRKLEKIQEGYTTYSNVYADCIYDSLKNNENIFLISAAMITGASLENCFKDFPTRCVDVGIAEEHAIAYANGLAIANKMPIVSMYSTFMQRGYDEIVHDVARINSNVMFIVDRAGIVGEDGKTHQGVLDVSFLYPLENTIIAMPSSYEYIKPTFDMLLNIKGPKFMRLQKMCLPINDKTVSIEFGKFIIDKFNSDYKFSLIAIGHSYSIIKELLKDEPINLINPLFLKPLDYETLDKVKNTTLILYDNTSVYEGTCSEIFHYMNKYQTKIICYCIKNNFIQHGAYDDILKYLNLDEKYIASCIKEIIYGKN